MIVAGALVNVDKRIVRSFLLQEIIEFGFELVGLLFVQIGVDDVWDGHATDPVPEDCEGQRFRGFGFDGLEHGDLGGFFRECEDEFVVPVGNERAMDVQMHGGVGNLRCFLCVLKHLAIVAGFRMCGDILTHAQPTIILLKLLHLVSDGHVWMPLSEIADNRLSGLER